MTALFLGGADRSGTTLVADLVGTHANVSPIYDTEFVVSLLTLILGDHTPSKAALPERVLVLMERWIRGFVAKQQGRVGERYQHGSQYFLFRRRVVMDETKRLLQNLNRGADPTIALRRMITVLFDMHARSDGKLKWLNKTPAYVDVLPELGAVFPEMRFIHCLRDGRDVVASIVAQPWGPNTIAEATQWWARKVRAGQLRGRDDEVKKWRSTATAREAELTELMELQQLQKVHAEEHGSDEQTLRTQHLQPPLVFWTARRLGSASTSSSAFARVRR